MDNSVNLSSKEWDITRVTSGIWVSIESEVEIPEEGIVLTIKDENRCFVSEHILHIHETFIPIDDRHVLFTQIGNYAKYVNRTGLDDYFQNI